MKKVSLAKAWDCVGAQLESHESAEISAEKMASLYGGRAEGLIKSISADCSSDGVSCWKKLQQALYDSDLFEHGDKRFY